jgi:hypothetical protein
MVIQQQQRQQTMMDTSLWHFMVVARRVVSCGRRPPLCCVVVVHRHVASSVGVRMKGIWGVSSLLLLWMAPRACFATGRRRGMSGGDR